MTSVVSLKEDAEVDIPYAPSRRSAAPHAEDRVEIAGHTILGLLNRAATAAEENSKQALEIAHKLSRQLRAAEDRIVDLEADLRVYQDRAERAERWLQQISVEIEQRFFKPANSGRR